MPEFLIGILLLIAGIGLTFAGLRVFMWLLPIHAFIAGFFLGASVVSGWLDHSFLGTVAGWVVGIILGAIFAFFSYAYWYIGAILGAAAVGAVLAMGLVSLLGGEATWVLVLAALIGAGLFGFFALIARLPFVIVMVQTAFAGAIMTIVSLLLIFQQVDLESVRWGTPWEFPGDSWFWWVVMVVLAVAGIVVQRRTMLEVALPELRWIRADAAARQAAARSNDAESRQSETVL